MFDLFDFIPVEGDPFDGGESSDPEIAARKKQPYGQVPPGNRTMPNIPSALPPRFEDLPTPMGQQTAPPNDLAPLPPGLPSAVRNRILVMPSYGEGDIQAPYQFSTIENALAGQPRQPEPQTQDIRRLFQRHILEGSAYPSISGNYLADIIRGGHLYGGENM